MDKLKKMICEYAGITEDKIDFSKRLTKDFGLDSFSLIALVTELEQEFEVNVSDEDLMSYYESQNMTAVYALQSYLGIWDNSIEAH